MYNCVKCVYICVIVGFDLLVSVGFKTSGRCLLKGGKYVTWYPGTSLGENLDLTAGYCIGLNIRNYAAFESWRSS